MAQNEAAREAAMEEERGTDPSSVVYDVTPPSVPPAASSPAAPTTPPSPPPQRTTPLTELPLEDLISKRSRTWVESATRIEARDASGMTWRETDDELEVSFSPLSGPAVPHPLNLHSTP